MSLIIKGMCLPKHAAVDGEKDTVYKCAVLAHPDNTVELVIDEIFVTSYYKRYNGNDIQHYPLTEIPTPHGKLIDADELKKDRINLYGTTDVVLMVDIENAPTTIEAGVSE